MIKRSAELWKLFSVFFRVGLFTFGGGYAMLSVIEDACVVRRGWITHEELDDLIVVAESTPGPVAINCATFVGARRAGFPGAFWATLGMVLPSFVIILAISRFLDRFLELRVIANAFRGIQAAVSILILNAGLGLLRRIPKRPLPLTIFAVTLGAMAAVHFLNLRLSSIVLMLGAGAVSLLAQAAGKGGGK